ncbi:MAG TPA: YigZ family protein [Bacteroidales bacterium]|nr:YigZ family protein [Bacteroidales bacterium]HRZ21873.1 YigZ family protein [Bacteroidales bacterium]
MSNPDIYKTIREPASGQYRDRGSKFIGLAFPVTTEEQIRQHLALLRKQYHDAHHHCYAWALGADRSRYRVNDDGEPSGSAGKPIYGQILSENLSDLLIVVIRYFGGTKLGIPGLIRAYRTAAGEALSKAQVINRTVTVTLQIRCSYPMLNEVMHLIRENNLDISENNFQDECVLTVEVRKSLAEETLAKFNERYGITIRQVAPSTVNG